MGKRYVTIWFPYLLTDWITRRRADLSTLPVVVSAPDHGKMIITATNQVSRKQGVIIGMPVADARVFVPSLQVFNDQPGLAAKLLYHIAEWCIRFTPVVAVDPPDGLILDVTGCAHLWGGEKNYLAEMISRLKTLGYTARAGIADTIGAAWAVTRYDKNCTIIDPGQQSFAILLLPPTSLRLDPAIVQRLLKLGLRQTRDFINMPRSAIRRRFGQAFLKRLDQALGQVDEEIHPVHPVEPYQERLPCPDPIVTVTGIEIALRRLLETVCQRLIKEEKGLRIANFSCYRVDGKKEMIQAGTNRASQNLEHLFKLFEFKIATLEPGPGIELFILEAKQIEKIEAADGVLWKISGGPEDKNVSELLDRIAGKIGAGCIHRYLPAEHFWPERSIKLASSLDEQVMTPWKTDRPRPLQLLSTPALIEVTAPIPDYPPMLFRYKGILHKIIKADGPERIEQEWWLQQGQHRDYYSVEDEEGQRYWLFRSGHYTDKNYQWFIHGFFS